MAYTKLDRVRPSPAGVWDSARTYTALELVNSPDGWKAYLARKAVPAGTALTDVTYWTEVLDVSDVIAAAQSATDDANAAAAFAEPIRTKADGIKCTIEGASVAATDASDDYLRGLRVFGKTTQDGTPSPENPVELVNVGSEGSIAVTVEGDGATQSLTLSTPDGLPGIPVTNDGNYTDADGQQWICDEVDLGRGVYVQRIDTFTSARAADWGFVATYQSGTYRMSTGLLVDTAYYKSSAEAMVLANIAKQTSADGTYMLKPGIGFNGAGNLIWYDENIQTTAALDAVLTETPIVVLYVLKTPVETALSATEIAAYRALHSNYPNTTVYNDAGAHMAVSYNADTKTYIDNKFAALSAAIV